MYVTSVLLLSTFNEWVAEKRHLGGGFFGQPTKVHELRLYLINNEINSNEN